MFKKCLLVSVMIHILVIAGAGWRSPHVSSTTPPVLQLMNAGLQETSELAGREGENRRTKFTFPNQIDLEKSGRKTTGSPRLETLPTVQPQNVEIKKNRTDVNYDDSVNYQEQIQNGLSQRIIGVPDTCDEPGNFDNICDNITSGGNSSGNDLGIGIGNGAGIIQHTRAPLKTYHWEPFYPMTARKNRWEGIVILEVELGKNGRIGKITLIQSSGYQTLDTEAMKAVKKWRYQPAVKDGESIEWQLRIRIIFKLEE